MRRHYKFVLLINFSKLANSYLPPFLIFWNKFLFLWLNQGIFNQFHKTSTSSNGFSKHLFCACAFGFINNIWSGNIFDGKLFSHYLFVFIVASTTAIVGLSQLHNLLLLFFSDLSNVFQFSIMFFHFLFSLNSHSIFSFSILVKKISNIKYDEKNNVLKNIRQIFTNTKTKNILKHM